MVADSGRSASQIIRNYVGKKVGLWSSTLSNAQTKADLALLRKYAGKRPGDSIEPWTVILDGNEDEIEQILGSYFYPQNKRLTGLTKGQVSLFYALTLYAIHQQSISDRSMDKKGEKIGKALKSLVSKRASNGGSTADETQKIYKKLKALAGKKDLIMQMSDLKGLISLLHSSQIPIDYSMLAADIFSMQFPETKNRVFIRWINDFNRFKAMEENDNE